MERTGYETGQLDDEDVMDTDPDIEAQRAEIDRTRSAHSRRSRLLPMPGGPEMVTSTGVRSSMQRL